MILLGCWGLPSAQRGFVLLSPFAAHQCPYAIRGRRRAHTRGAAHLVCPPKTRRADSLAAAPALRHLSYKVVETGTNTLRWCWSSGRPALVKPHLRRGEL